MEVKLLLSMMQIFNTFTHQLEEFEPLNPPVVKFYACGPTVYDFAHLGHLRKYCMDDILIRTLLLNNFEVKHVQNVTDVGHLTSDADSGEDKIEKGARKYALEPLAVAKKFEDYFYYSMDLIGNLRPTIVCRATENIPAMLALVETLEAKGFTYIIEGDGVYFDTSKLDHYGQLAGLDIEQLMAGARVAPVAGKKNVTDFALWKFERPGENRAMTWPSKWSERSYPGWHIECSAMSMKYLGDQLDIHTGGVDHIAVHHTNEIAQSESATGKKPFSKYWVHHNFLKIENEKMSKSLNNFFTIDDVIARGFSPQALRLLFLSTHYRSEMNFTWENLAGAETSWQKLQRLMASWMASSNGKTTDSVPAQTYHQQFFTALNKDLDTPTALAILWQVTKDNALSEAEKYALLLEFDQVFGLGLDQIKFLQQETAVDALPSAVQQLLQARQQARESHNFAQADQLRDELASLGYQVNDTPTGQKLTQL